MTCLSLSSKRKNFPIAFPILPPSCRAIILPLVDVSFGVGAGAFEGDKKNNGGGGLAGKMSPCAVLVIQNGSTKLVNVKNQDGLTKVLDMVPDFVNRFAPGAGNAEDTDGKEE